MSAPRSEWSTFPLQPNESKYKGRGIRLNWRWGFSLPGFSLGNISLGVYCKVLGIWTEGWSLVHSFPLNSLLKAFWVHSIFSTWDFDVLCVTQAHDTQMLNLHSVAINTASVDKSGWQMRKLMRNAEIRGGNHSDHTEMCHCRCIHFGSLACAWCMHMRDEWTESILIFYLWLKIHKDEAWSKKVSAD